MSEGSPNQIPLPRRERLGMGMTTLLAVITTAIIGWSGERLYDPRQARAAMLEDADALARGEMLELGWHPITPRTVVPGHVEILEATRSFTLPLGNGPVAGAPPSQQRERLALSLIREELGRYPSSFIDKARLRRVLFCQGLSEAARPIPSLPNFQSTLLLDVDAPPEFLRRLIHHEVFHFADYAADDQVQRDPAWEKLNGSSFSYGSGGRFLRDPASSSPDGAPEGFVTRYATSALEEDKAETFAFLMVAPGATLARAHSDRVLSAKIHAIELELGKLDPAMNAGFWSRAGVL
jgi:hypothetical protein